jgi:hypothetical protein
MNDVGEKEKERGAEKGMLSTTLVLSGEWFHMGSNVVVLVNRALLYTTFLTTSRKDAKAKAK